MSKQLVKVKMLRDGISTPRISNSVKDKEYWVSIGEARALTSGEKPAAKVISGGELLDETVLSDVSGQLKEKEESLKSKEAELAKREEEIEKKEAELNSKSELTELEKQADIEAKSNTSKK